MEIEQYVEKVKTPAMVVGGISLSLATVYYALKAKGLFKNYDDLKKKLKLYRKYQNMKKSAVNLNHLLLLMSKSFLKLPIEKDESLVSTYIDLKRYFKEDWPFMWKVTNVKDTHVTVNDNLKCIPFSSYSYLDLVRDDDVQEAAIEAAKQYATGNHGPRMLGGNTAILREFEKEIADFFGKEDCIVASSGYLACMSAIAGLAGKGDYLIVDQFSHASLRSGYKLSGAKVIYFKHNDFEDAEKKIKKLPKKGKKYMVIESVYSMDGDIGNLPKARELCDKHKMLLFVDEAHGVGALGKTGRGLEEYYNMPGAADIIVGSMTKSLSSVGGFICTKRSLVEYYEFFSQGNMFSAPLSAYHAGGALAALRKIKSQPELLEKLHNNVLYFREKLNNAKWSPETPDKLKYKVIGVPGQAVCPVVFKDDPMRVLYICSKLRNAGFMTGAVVAPACPLREPRLRITVQSTYTKEMMDKFVDTLVEIAESVEPFKLDDSL